MKFRAMRRQDRQMDMPEAFLASNNWGVLSVMSDEGYPYGVPVNYAYVDGKIFFHSTCAKSHKLDAIRENPKVCFTVVGQHDLIEAEYTTQFSSVILFGTARIITDEEEKRTAAVKMMRRLAPAVEQAAIESCGRMKTAVMVEITPEHITGKERK